MFKKLLALLVLLTPAGVAVRALNFGYSFNEAQKTAVITSSEDRSSSEEVIIPLKVIVSGVTYDVIGIADGAINNVSGMKTVKIHKGIRNIGTMLAKPRPDKVVPSSAGVFENCPDLEKIIVEEGNPVAASTNAGILTSADGQIVYCVPPSIRLSSTTLKMSTKQIYIAENAFLGNRTIAEIAFSKDIEGIHALPGFHTMKQLDKFTIPGNNSPRYEVARGALIDKNTRTLISFPPHWIDGVTFTVDIAKSTNIARYAFANNASLVKITLPEGVRYIGDHAFAGSNLATIIFPESFTLYRENVGMLRECGRLTSIQFNNAAKSIPADFARNCQILTELKFTKGNPEDLGAKAFSGCRKLASFSFSPDIRLLGDSIFAGTGFKKVAFPAGNYNWTEADWSGIFAGCNDLEEIDLSAVKGADDNSPFLLPERFASDCIRLKKVKFPENVRFVENSFLGNNALEHIILRNFSIEGTRGGISYTGDGGTFSPNIYLLSYSESLSEDDLANSLLKARGKMTLKPNCFISSFDNSLGGVWSNYTYYIPGAALDSYDPFYHRSLHEMFLIEISGGYFRTNVTCVPNIPGVEIRAVDFGGLKTVGYSYTTPCFIEKPIADLQYIGIRYTVNGVAMYTKYPARPIVSGIADAIADAGESLSATIAGRTLRVDNAASTPLCTIFDTAGRKLLEAEGAEISLVGIPAGFYVVAVSDGKASRTLRVALR